MTKQILIQAFVVVLSDKYSVMVQSALHQFLNVSSVLVFEIVQDF